MAPDTDERVRSIVDAHRLDRGPLLPILHDIQAEFGYVDPSVVPVIADGLNLSRADVHGVVSFYHDFKAQPTGRTVVRLCRAEACQARGCDALVEHAQDALGVEVGQTTADGSVTLDQVFCFGNCALGPTVEIAGALHGRVDAARFDALLAEARA